MTPGLWLFVHVFSLLLAAISILLIALLWRTGKVADAVVKYLGLADPDGRVSNRKVIATSGMFAAIAAAVTVTIKSVAASSVADIGGNIVLLWGLIVGGFAGHSALQAKFNPRPTEDQQAASAERRSSQAIAQPPEATS
jgi:hypothetical protein